MAINAVGTATSQRVVFNSGILTIGANQITDVKDITVNSSFDVKAYRTLNSIKKRALRRATFEASVKCTIEGLAKEIYAIFYGTSSTFSGGTEYTVLDSSIQNVMTCSITCYRDADATKAYQYTLTNPVFSKFDVNTTTEDFVSVDVEIQCTDITSDVNTTAEA